MLTNTSRSADAHDAAELSDSTDSAASPACPAPAADPALDAVFQALAHPVRREILDLLREGDRTVGELARPFTQSRPAISQHLDVLEGAGLVERIPEGRQNRCRLTGAPLVAAADWILAHARYWTEAFDRLEGHLLETAEPPEPGLRGLARQQTPWQVVLPRGACHRRSVE